MTYRKKIIKHIVALFSLVILYGLLLSLILITQVKATDANIYTVTGIVQQPEYRQEQKIAWISFSIHNTPFFADNHGQATLIDVMKELSQNQTPVSITYPKHRHMNPDLFLHETESEQAIKIVGANDNRVYYDSVSVFNERKTVNRIIFIIIVTLFFVPAIGLFSYSLYVTCYCHSTSKKKPAEQRVRAQSTVLTPEQRKNRRQARKRKQKKNK